MKKSYVLLVVLCQLTCVQLMAFQPDQKKSLETTIDSVLFQYTGTDRPGATIGIIKDGKLIFQKGYGMANLSSHTPNSAEVVYHVASGSKQFTAVMIASLIEQKKLSLKDTITKFFPEIPAYGKTITIENLLYHTSGIRDYMVLMWLTGKNFEEPFTNKDALAIIMCQQKLYFDPGTRCVYSNSNYILLAEIINRVTGKTLAEYAAQELFVPLGMRSSGFGGNVKKKGVRAMSYSEVEGIYKPFKNSFTAYGDGGVLTTLDDLLRWDNQFYDDNSIVQKILQRGKLNNGNQLSYGMGIMFSRYRDELVHSHPGAFLGYRSETLRFPEKKISIICLGNSETINPEYITRAIADLYVFGDKDNGMLYERSKHVSEKSQTAESAFPFTGIYQVAPNVLIHIQREQNLLSGQVTGQPKQMLYNDSSTTFKIGSTNDKAVFENMQYGKFQQLTVVQKQGSTVAQRVAVLNSNDHKRYHGVYYSAEQNATYRFYSKGNDLWFKAGASEAVKAEILVKYNRIYFGYKNLEQATIDFTLDSQGVVTGFVLNSGRVKDIQFVRK